MLLKWVTAFDCSKGKKKSNQSNFDVKKSVDTDSEDDQLIVDENPRSKMSSNAALKPGSLKLKLSG